MNRRFAAALLSAALLAPALPATAAPEPEDPKKQTEWGLYLTSTEAYELKQERAMRFFSSMCASRSRSCSRALPTWSM